mgnify:CR=1 FL=1
MPLQLKDTSVSFDNGRMGNIRILVETVAVNQQMLRTDLQLINGPVHGQKRSIQNINPVYLLGVTTPTAQAKASRSITSRKA